MGPRAGLNRCGKSRCPPGFDPRTVQPVAIGGGGEVRQVAKKLSYLTPSFVCLRGFYFIVTAIMLGCDYKPVEDTGGYRSSFANRCFVGRRIG